MGERATRQGIMLCYPFEIKRFDKWGGKALLQPKLNGERCRAIFNAEGKVTLLSSTMHQVTGVPHIVRQLQEMHIRNLELDGELYYHQMDFEEIHGIVSRKVSLHPDFDSIQYHVFDIVDHNVQEERLKQLQSLGPKLNGSSIQRVPTHTVLDLTQVGKWFDHYVERGYEGIVLRKMANQYERKRSTQMMKYKPREEDIYSIIGVKQEIDKNGRAKEALGAFICKVNEENTFSIGTGSLLTRDNRILLWKQREFLPGMYLHIKYQSITGANAVPLFPVAVTLWTKKEYDEWKTKRLQAQQQTEAPSTQS